MSNEGKTQTRLWLYDLFAHDAAEKMRVARAAMALGYGLDPNEYARPFPGSSVNIVMNDSQSQPSTKTNRISQPGWNPLALLLAGALGALGMNLVRPTAAPLPAPVPAAVAPAHKEIEVTWKIDKGQLKTDVRQVEP